MYPAVIPRHPAGSSLGSRQAVALLTVLVVGGAAAGTALATVVPTDAPVHQAGEETELVDDGVYQYGTILVRSEGVSPNEVITVEGADDAGNDLFLNTTATVDGVVRIDTAEAFPNAQPPAEFGLSGEDGTPRLSFVLTEDPQTTTTPVPSAENFDVFVEPRRVEAGGATEVIISGGTPNSRAGISVGDLGPERVIELFEEGRPQYNESYDFPTVSLDERGQWEGVLRAHGGLLEPGRSYTVVAVDVESGREAGADLQVVGEGTTTRTTAPDVGTAPPDDEVTQAAADTPARGFFINGADGPLAPIANMLNLTMIGFILSVFGILYQLMEGR